MKRYAAIGHWKSSDDIVSIAEQTNSIKAFRDDMRGNGFVPYMIITESKLGILKNAGKESVFEEVKKSVSNFRVWLDVTDYICQCFDIIETKIANAQ